MKIKSFGCSFIFGTDLSDDIHNGRYAYPSQLTWPALIAKRTGIAYECFARAGSGNLRILESIIAESATSDSNDLFVINWTWIDRFDYTTADDAWKTILPVNETAEADFYYRNLHSQYKDKLLALTYIQSAIDLLNRKKIPFVMTYMDELIFEKEWHCSPAILTLQKDIKPYLLDFEGRTFLNWAKYNKYPISAGMHPLDQAHSVAAEYISNKIRN